MPIKIILYHVFTTNNGDIIIAFKNDRQFRALCDVVNLGHLEPILNSPQTQNVLIIVRL